MQDPATLSPTEVYDPTPIVLNPGLDKAQTKQAKSGRGVFSTFGILLAGWFFGNLILLGVLAIAVAVTASSTGLVKVPFFTEKFFGASAKVATTPDAVVLETAQGKIAKINHLSSTQTLASLEFSEDELNALFAAKVEEAGSFPLNQPKIVIKDGKFLFTGRLVETNAPVEITGTVNTSGLVANIEVTEAKFGKIVMPNFIASNLLDSYLASVNLSLSGSQIPASSINLDDGAVTLVKVSKPEQ